MPHPRPPLPPCHVGMEAAAAAHPCRCARYGRVQVGVWVGGGRTFLHWPLALRRGLATSLTLKNTQHHLPPFTEHNSATSAPPRVTGVEREGLCRAQARQRG